MLSLSGQIQVGPALAERIIRNLLHVVGVVGLRRLPDRRLVRVRSFLWLLVEDGLGNTMEEFVDVGALECRRLVVGQIELLRQLLALLSRNLSVWQVDFVRNEHLVHIFARVRLNLLEPVGNILEGGLLRAIVD